MTAAAWPGAIQTLRPVLDTAPAPRYDHPILIGAPLSRRYGIAVSYQADPIIKLESAAGWGESYELQALPDQSSQN